MNTPLLTALVFIIATLYVSAGFGGASQAADLVRDRWQGIEGIAIVQRIVELHPCTPTVLIACAAAHRALLRAMISSSRGSMKQIWQVTLA